MSFPGGHEFFADTLIKSTVGLTTQKVSEVLNKNEFLLLSKRKKLGDSLTSEIECLSQELELFKIKEEANRVESMKNQSLAIRAKREAERKDLAMSKLEAYARENNEELRIKESEMKCRDAAVFNMQQFERKNKLAMKKREIDAIIDRILQEQIFQQDARDKDRMRKKMEDRLYENIILKNQILEKAQKIKEEMSKVVEELAYVKQLVKDHAEYEKCEKQKIMEARHSLAKEKYENLIRSLEEKKKKELSEMELAKIIMKVEAPLTHYNQDAVKLKEQWRLEQDLYIESQRNLKEQLKMMETYEEELRKSELMKFEEREQKKKIQETLFKHKQNKEILKMQVYQILDKNNRHE